MGEAMKEPSELLPRFGDSEKENFEVAAWKQLRLEYDRRLWSYLRRVAPLHQDRRELMADIWAEVFVRAGCQNTELTWESLLASAADSIRTLSRWRRHIVTDSTAQERLPSAADPDRVVRLRLEDWVLERVLALPPQQRKCLECIYLGGMSGAEAARAMGCTHATVRAHRRKAIIAIRRAAGGRGFSSLMDELE
jgi:RNA polymerase sigma factor (sigma-70 family)